MQQHGPLNNAEFLTSCRDLIAKRHPQSYAAFANTGEFSPEQNGRKHIQMLVLYPKMTAPFHEYDTLADLSFEAFVHEEDTLDRALRESDFASGVPFYSRLILEGKCLSNNPTLDGRLKCKAQKNLDRGPPILSNSEVAAQRLIITRLIDDLLAPSVVRANSGPLESLYRIGKLYGILGDFWLRAQGRWSAAGNDLQRVITRMNPEFGERLRDAFVAATQGSLEELETVVFTVLEPYGGPLRTGYRSELGQIQELPLLINSTSSTQCELDEPQIPKPLFELSILKLSESERVISHPRLGPISLRNATLSDATVMRNLLRDAYGARAQEGLNFTASYQDEEMTRQSLLKTDRQTIIALAGDQLVATFQLCLEKKSTPGNGIYFNRFAVDPNFQKHGLGGAILEHAAEIARSRGFKQMWLDTAQPANDLVSFYQRHGFKIDRQTWYVGKTYASWVMRRELELIPTSVSAGRA
jgi:GNAT superfamily N-acetyltransferase